MKLHTKYKRKKGRRLFNYPCDVHGERVNINLTTTPSKSIHFYVKKTTSES